MTTLTRGPVLRTPMPPTSGPPGTQDRMNIIAWNRLAEQVHLPHFLAHFVLGLLCGFAAAGYSPHGDHRHCRPGKEAIDSPP